MYLSGSINKTSGISNQLWGVEYGNSTFVVMCISVLISSGYELTKYRINRVVIKEKGILLGGCLTVRN